MTIVWLALGVCAGAARSAHAAQGRTKNPAIRKGFSGEKTAARKTKVFRPLVLGSKASTPDLAELHAQLPKTLLTLERLKVGYPDAPGGTLAYHGLHHPIELASAAYKAALEQGFAPREAWLVHLAALLHDFHRVAGAQPTVRDTLKLLADDYHGRKPLFAMPSARGGSVLRALGLTLAEFNALRAMIQETDYSPTEAPKPNRITRRLRRSYRRLAQKGGKLLGSLDKVVFYANDYARVVEGVQAFAEELNRTPRTVAKNLATAGAVRFLSKALGDAETRRALGALSGAFRLQIERNLRAFKTLEAVYGQTGDLAEAVEAGRAAYAD